MRKTYCRTIGRWAGVLSALFCAITLAGVGQAAPVIVQMIEFQRVEEAEWQRAVVERYHASQDDIRVELISLAGSSPAVKPLTMIAAGVPLDISYHDPYKIIEWTHQGLVQDLTPYLARDRAPFAEFFDPLLDLYVVKGGRYGIPLDLQVQAFFYREDFFDEAGVAYPREGMTWEDIARISPHLLLQSEEGVISRYAIRFPQFWHWWSILWHHGASFFDDERNPTRFVGDSTAMRQGLEFLRSMIHDKRVMSQRRISGSTAAPDRLAHGLTQPPAIAAMQFLGDLYATKQVAGGGLGAFTASNLAMHLGGHWEMARELRTLEDPWDVAPIPQLDLTRQVTMGWASGLAIPTDAKNKQGAWELAKFLAGSRGQELFIDLQVAQPALRSLARSKAWRKSTPAHYEAFISQLDYAASPPYIPGYAQVQTLWSQAMRPLWSGTSSAASALSSMAPQVDAILKEFAAK